MEDKILDISLTPKDKRKFYHLDVAANFLIYEEKSPVLIANKSKDFREQLYEHVARNGKLGVAVYAKNSLVLEDEKLINKLFDVIELNTADNPIKANVILMHGKDRPICVCLNPLSKDEVSQFKENNMDLVLMENHTAAGGGGPQCMVIPTTYVGDQILVHEWKSWLEKHGMEVQPSDMFCKAVENILKNKF